MVVGSQDPSLQNMTKKMQVLAWVKCQEVVRFSNEATWISMLMSVRATETRTPDLHHKPDFFDIHPIVLP